MDTKKKPGIGRIVALFEVILCSDFPTQLAVGATLNVIGLQPMTGGVLSLRYLVYLSLIDTVLLLGLIVFFLRSHRERVRDLLFGSRSWLREAELGIPLVAGAFLVAIVVISLTRLLVPALHNLERNPLEALIHGRLQAALFGIVVVVAGGVREEVQRAFILHRFEVWLGGPAVGLIVSSVLFGLGHKLQGNDVAIATGALGLYWGAIYLRRRSCVAPMVSHAGFNLIELLQFFVTGR